MRMALRVKRMTIHLGILTKPSVSRALGHFAFDEMHVRSRKFNGINENIFFQSGIRLMYSFANRITVQLSTLK